MATMDKLGLVALMLVLMPSSVLPETPAMKGSVIRGGASYRSEQGADYSPAVSAETVGSKVLFVGTVSLPPGGRTKAHVHARHESAFYMVSGEEVELWTGPALEHRDVAHPCDFLFIPENV